LLPAIAQADPDTLLVADGFSCRTQIRELTDRQARHTVQVLAQAVDPKE
jgi:Fe-S oxidoreductase